MLATERTGVLARLEIAAIAVGVPLAYFLVAQPEGWILPGLGLGALGLSLKYVLIQVLSTNLLCWRNCVFLETRFAGHVAHQALVLLVFAAIAWPLTLLGRVVFPDPGPIAATARLALDGTLYTSLAIALIWLLPSVIGYDKARMRLMVDGLRERFS
jgi:hypothetical protein